MTLGAESMTLLRVRWGTVRTKYGSKTFNKSWRCRDSWPSFTPAIADGFSGWGVMDRNKVLTEPLLFRDGPNSPLMAEMAPIMTSTGIGTTWLGTVLHVVSGICTSQGTTKVGLMWSGWQRKLRLPHVRRWHPGVVENLDQWAEWFCIEATGGWGFRLDAVKRDSFFYEEFHLILQKNMNFLFLKMMVI